MMTFPYREVFAQAESSLLEYGCRHRPVAEIVAALGPFKAVPQEFSDDEFFEKLTAIVFYAGFRAATVTERMPVIKGHFPDWKTVARYGEEDKQRILNDPGMIRHERKVRAVMENARAFVGIVKEFGSFQNYVDSFRPNESFEQASRSSETSKGGSHTLTS